MEGGCLQRNVCRNLQHAAAAARRTLWLAPSSVLSEMIKFAKGHAYGNDFLYVLKRDMNGIALDRFAQSICDRHTGVGADGLIVYEPTAAGALMQLFDADGGRAQVSGNGVRVLGALLLRDDHRPQAELVVETDGAPKRPI